MVPMIIKQLFNKITIQCNIADRKISKASVVNSRRSMATTYFKNLDCNNKIKEFKGIDSYD